MLQVQEERQAGPLERWKRAAVVLFVVLATVGMARWLSGAATGPPIALPTIAADARPARDLTVHVTGAVLRPGLYTLTDGRRVADAVDQAGGPADGADVGRLNLASRVQDGQQIVVPRLGDAASLRPPSTPIRNTANARPLIPAGGSISSRAPAGRMATPPRSALPPPSAEHRLNLNRASVAELELLPALGAASAVRIVRYRDEHGPFSGPDDLRRARLISGATLDRIRDLIEAP